MDKSKGVFEGSKDLVIMILVFMSGMIFPVLDQFIMHALPNFTFSGIFLGVATIATIWIPGAGLSKSEGWQRFTLSHFSLGLFGNFAGALVVAVIVEAAGVGHIVEGAQPLFTMAYGIATTMLVFLAFWSNGHQSRDYVAQVYFQAGWHLELKAATRIIGLLCGSDIKRPDLARQMRDAIMNGRFEDITGGDPDDGFWRDISRLVKDAATRGSHKQRMTRWLAEARAELVAEISNGSTLHEAGRPERGAR